LTPAEENDFLRFSALLKIISLRRSRNVSRPAKKTPPEPMLCAVQILGATPSAQKLHRHQIAEALERIDATLNANLSPGVHKSRENSLERRDDLDEFEKAVKQAVDRCRGGDVKCTKEAEDSYALATKGMGDAPPFGEYLSGAVEVPREELPELGFDESFYVKLSMFKEMVCVPYIDGDDELCDGDTKCDEVKARIDKTYGTGFADKCAAEAASSAAEYVSLSQQWINACTRPCKAGTNSVEACEEQFCASLTDRIAKDQCKFGCSRAMQGQDDDTCDDLCKGRVDESYSVDTVRPGTSALMAFA